MLSYLKDEQNRPPEGDTTPQQDEDKQSTLSRQSDYLTVSGHGEKLRKSTLLLVLMFGVGVLGVWLMVKKATPAQVAASTDDQTQIEAAIAQLNGMQSEMNEQMDSAVGRFYQASNIGQVSVNELKKNPFKRELGAGQAEADLHAQRRNEQQLIEDSVRRAAATLQLWSITATPRGACCMINDKVLYLGDEINGLTVVDIDSQFVALQRDDVTIQLKMDE